MSDLINVADLSHDDVIKHYPELVQNELAFEEEAVSIAKEALEAAIASRGLVDGSPTAYNSLRSCVKATSVRIDEWLAEQALTRRKSNVLPHITALTSDQLAYIVCRELLNNTMVGTTGFTNACAKVGEQVRRTLEYAMFEEANEGLAKVLEQQLKRSTSARHRQSVFRAAMRSADFEGLRWDIEQKASVGFILVNAFIDATGLVERIVSTHGKTTTASLSPSVTMGLLLAEADTFDAFLTPYHYPMVIPPQPWTDLDEGGYLNQQQHPLTLVKTKNGRAHKAQLEAADLSDVMAAINAIQATPWRINVQVLEVFRALHGEGNGTAKLASAVEPSITPKPWGVLTDEEWAVWRADPANTVILEEWKREAKNDYHSRTQWASKRLVQQQQIKLAERFAEEPVMYFPHTVDFRGRIYPAAGLGAVNPQGNDVGKALLEFARGKALGPTGGRWLAIHLANTFGYDKLLLEDRELWALSNSDMIAACAEAPLENLEWTKADKPFGFLAACFEWCGYMMEGEAFVSHIPIAMDGSCSGLQHFAAMLLDQKTAEAVNVVQTGAGPRDVYMGVLNAVAAAVAEFSNGMGNTAAELLMAGEWLVRLMRDSVKQPVMTTPYGVTARGIIGQIATNSKKAIGNGKMQPFSVPFYDAAKWLGPYVNEAISSEMSAAKRAMDWLTDVAKITAKGGFPVRWETPIGMLAVQDYRKQNGRRVEIKWAGQTQKMTLQKSGSQVDGRRQSSGLAPNFVHSMDACHLMITTNNAVEYGIKDFAMIHDSFACHAADTELHNQIIRECFIAMYSGNVLLDFYEGLREQLDEKTFAKIPLPPEQGTLDLAAVRDSQYFFA